MVWCLILTRQSLNVRFGLKWSCYIEVINPCRQVITEEAFTPESDICGTGVQDIQPGAQGNGT